MMKVILALVGSMTTFLSAYNSTAEILKPTDTTPIKYEFNSY